MIVSAEPEKSSRRAARPPWLTDDRRKVAVEGTPGYEEFLHRKLHRVPGFRHSRSSFTLRCLKRVHSVVPVET